MNGAQFCDVVVFYTPMIPVSRLTIGLKEVSGFRKLQRGIEIRVSSTVKKYLHLVHIYFDY